MVLTQRKLKRILDKALNISSVIGRTGCFLLAVTYNILKIKDRKYTTKYIGILVSEFYNNPKFRVNCLEESKFDHQITKPFERLNILPNRGNCYQIVYTQGGSHFIRVIDHIIYCPARGIIRSSLSNYLFNILNAGVRKIIDRGNSGLVWRESKEVFNMAKRETFDKLFSTIVPKVIEFEGGWVNDPDDPGGETVIGVCRKYWPKFSGWPIVDSLKIKGIPRISANILKDLRERAAKEVYPFYRAFESNFVGRADDASYYGTVLFFSVHAGVNRATDACLLSKNLDEVIEYIRKYYRQLFVRKPCMSKYKNNFATRLSMFAGRKVQI